MLNDLNNFLINAQRDHLDGKRRLNTFNLQVRRTPRPTKKWSLNSSLEPVILQDIAPKREKDLTTI